MEVKIKRLHKDSVIPKYAKSGDAGLDLTAISKVFDVDNNIMSYGTGLAIEIPEGYVGLLFPRSSCYKKRISLSNSVGVIDSGYRGEITFKYRTNYMRWKIDKEFNMDTSKYEYEIGDRIGQLIIIPYPKIELVEVDELSDSERGIGGYGSSGN